MKLVVSHLKKRFGSKEVLKDIDFTFQQGSIYALLGRNGSGKTTLFNLIASNFSKDAGTVKLIEEDGSMHDIKNEDIFLMVAEPILPRFLTGYEFIKFFVEVHHVTDVDIDAYFNQIEFHPQDRHRLIQSYSTGMKNKLQMIMFLILKPKIILMDEPLTSLDVVIQLQMKRIIKQIQKDHIIIFSTHILQLAKDLCEELVILNDGYLQAIDQEVMHTQDFEHNIIELLKDKEDEHH